MKKLIITCSLLVLSSIVSFAQGVRAPGQAANATASQNTANYHQPPPEYIAEKRARMYEKQLSLTPEQYKSVYEAELNYANQEKQVRGTGKPGQAQFGHMMTEKDETFKKVLTSGQYAKYDASRPRVAINQAQ